MQKEIIRNNYNYIDLFAGCGGLSLGLHHAGWNGLFAIEKSPDAFKTLEHNLITKIEHFSWPTWLPVTNHNINEVLKNYKHELLSLRGKVDLVAGGPPCQGFSSAGRRKEDDARNKLVDSYIEFISCVKPKIIFFENVRGFTCQFKNNSELGKKYSSHVIHKLEELDYDVHGELVDFSEYGVPQKRTRFILVGIHKDQQVNQDQASSFFELLKTNSFQILKDKGLKPSVSLEEAISDLLAENGKSSCKEDKRFNLGLYSKAKTSYQKYLRQGRHKGSVPDSHRFANHTSTIKDRFKFAIKHNLGPKEYRDYFGLSKTSTKKTDATVQVPTLTTLPDDYIHYKEPRIFTVREYARIQSFPDTYEIKGKYTTGSKLRVKETPRYTQIGNAIPPLFAEIAGHSLSELLND